MLLIWVLAAVSALCWILFFYPYFFYPLTLRFMSARPIRRAPVETRASLLFSAHNEIACLPAKLANLAELKSRYPSLEILAYDDASTDGTSQLLEHASPLLTVVRGPGRTGKAAGMKRLVDECSGDILIFTDADVRIQPDAIEKLLSYYADPDVGGVCGSVRMVGEERSTTSEAGSLYWGLDDRLQQLESASGNVIGASGALFSVRRQLYPEFPDTVQDDFTVSMHVVFSGKRMVKATDVVAFTNSVGQSDEEMKRKVRIGMRAYHTHSFLRAGLRTMPPRDRFKYMSRKLLRWFGGVFVIVGTMTALAAIALKSIFAAVILLVTILIFSMLSIRASRGHLSKLGQMGVATFATLFGVIQGMRGRTQVTWSPAKSR